MLIDDPELRSYAIAAVVTLAAVAIIAYRLWTDQ